MSEGQDTFPSSSNMSSDSRDRLKREMLTPKWCSSIYGLSTDSPKSNTTFKIKQNLPYTLLCDPAATLIGAIGMKKKPNGTTRGVFVVNKEGKVEAVSPGVSLLLFLCLWARTQYSKVDQGPAATVDAVRNIIGGEKVGDSVEKLAEGEKVEKEAEEEAEQPKSAKGDGMEAEVAAEVADSAQKLDTGVQE